MTAASPLDQARQLRDQGRYGEAYNCILQLPWPSNELAPYLLRGSLERHLGLLNEAESSLALALGHPPHHGLACYELGELQRSLGRFNAAAGWFLAALRHAPHHHWIHNALQFTRYGHELLPRVAAEYEQHCLAHPNDAMALHLLAEVLLKLERKAEAITTARRAARRQLGEQSAWIAPTDATPYPPDFIIIGVPKAGTTSLLHWLGNHPQIWAHPRKELHFFNGAWEQGTAWYSAQFPVFQSGSGVLRGEATPNYFHNPLVPIRVSEAAPEARLILLLRDPLERAISWIEHLRRYEGLQGSTEELLLEELEQLEANPGLLTGASPSLPGSQALLGSCYDQPLARWQKKCRNRILVLRSELLFSEPTQALNHCYRFLSLEAHSHADALIPQNTNPRKANTLTPAATQRLNDFLAKANTCLPHRRQGRHTNTY